jgi:hypothetical protein
MEQVKIIYTVELPLHPEYPKQNGQVLTPTNILKIGITDYGYCPLKIGTEYDFSNGRAYDFEIPFNKKYYGIGIMTGDPVYLTENDTGGIDFRVSYFRTSAPHGGEKNYITEIGEFLATHQVRILKEIIKNYTKDRGWSMTK